MPSFQYMKLVASCHSSQPDMGICFMKPGMAATADMKNFALYPWWLKRVPFGRPE